LDAESMFYLQSRGIGKQDARSLLTYAFAQDIIPHQSSIPEGFARASPVREIP